MEKVLIANLRDSLQHLADIEFQRRSWLSADGPEISSFVELACQVFDDTGLSQVIDGPELEACVGRAAAERLRALDRAIADADEYIPPAEFIESPEMARIRDLARQALEAIDRGRETVARRSTKLATPKADSGR